MNTNEKKRRSSSTSKKQTSYNRYVLSKLSWNLAIPDIDMTWVKQSLDSTVNQYVRGWLEIPTGGTLDIIHLSKGKFGICYIMISTRFAQCQTIIRNNLRKSTNSDVVKIYHDTNCDTNYNTINSNQLKK